MENFRQILSLQQLGKGSRDIYPTFFVDSGKKKILFVSPRMSRYGLYNAIQPCAYLNAFSSHVACAITNIERENKKTIELSITTPDIEIQIDEIKMADAIILPFTGEPLSSVYESIREIKPSIKIGFCIDFNYFEVPNQHYRFLEIENSKDNFKQNIENSDFLVCQDNVVYNGVKKRLKCDKKCLVVPSIINPLQVEEGTILPKTKKGRFLIYSDMYRMQDIEMWSEIYQYVSKEYEEDIELLFIGYHPNNMALQLSNESEGYIVKSKKPGRKKKDESPVIENYMRLRNNDYMYAIKNMVSYQADLAIFLYAAPAKSAIDVDMVAAGFIGMPILTNDSRMQGANICKSAKSVKSFIDNFVESIRADNMGTYALDASILMRNTRDEWGWSSKWVDYMSAEFMSLFSEEYDKQNTQID